VNFLRKSRLAGLFIDRHGFPLGPTDGVQVDLRGGPVLTPQDPLDGANRHILSIQHGIQALLKTEFPVEISPLVERLAECAEFLAPDIHVQSDYGDEAGGWTPWELFDQDSARQALDIAEEAAELARQLFAGS
jgi:hypothetical protein